MMRFAPAFFAVVGFLFILALSGCSGVETEAKFPDRNTGDDGVVYTGERDSIFGSGGLTGIFKGSDKESESNASSIGVNSFLWRASLDSLSFMPISSADPFGGTIITDWHSPDGIEDERFKINVFILTPQLRADGLRASIFKQVKGVDGQWVEQAVSKETNTQLENTILTRARQLRVAQTGH